VHLPAWRDPAAQSCEQWSLRGRAYSRLATHGDSVRLAVLPAVVVALREIW